MAPPGSSVPTRRCVLAGLIASPVAIAAWVCAVIAARVPLAVTPDVVTHVLRAHPATRGLLLAVAGMLLDLAAAMTVIVTIAVYWRTRPRSAPPASREQAFANRGPLQ